MKHPDMISGMADLAETYHEQGHQQGRVYECRCARPSTRDAAREVFRYNFDFGKPQDDRAMRQLERQFYVDTSQNDK
jgi:hypothetical protein